MKHRILSLLAPLALAGALRADGGFTAHQQVDDTQGGFLGALADDDHFGSTVVNLGDLDGDGVNDLAVGAPYTDDGGLTDSGAIWILLMNADGTVQKQRKISLSSGGFTGTFPKRFGSSIARLGDVDGDGTVDLAVASEDLVHVLFLAPDGTVAAQTDLDWIGAYPLANADAIVAGLDDLDGDGTPDMVVRGIVSERLFFALLNPDGTTKSVVQYDPVFGTTGGAFGEALVQVGDVDGDGVQDLAVGDPNDSEGGAVWILFLDNAGGVLGAQKTSAVDMGYVGNGDLGESLARLGNLDGAGGPDLFSGSQKGDGVLWTLFLETDGTVRSFLDYQEADYGGTQFGDDFGAAVEAFDVDGDGVKDLLVGAPDTDAGGAGRGAFHVYFYEGVSAGKIELYPGCGLNPQGSLFATGTPAPGGLVEVALDNPLGTQNPGSLAFLALSFSGAAPGGSCGIPLPGLNMDPSKLVGELLVAPPIPLQIAWTASVWMGPGQPVTIPLAIPDGTALYGVTFVVQGLLLDPGAGLTGTQPVGLTRGARITLGT